ncbi:MAG TPA: hypothetical protein GX745_04245 [Clostridiales bacterium]|jgi:DNA-binding PadR family transcriptional regulator|nr:hypothetical protein [Clostridiales bacterium]
MDNYVNSDLIRGNIDTIILRSLSEGDKYGYEILKEIESKTQGEYILKQPTLYSCLKRLEKQGYITSFWGQITLGGRRKYYRLTPEGKEYFEKVQADWEYSRALIDKLIAKRRTTPQVDNQPSFEDNKDEFIESQSIDNSNDSAYISALEKDINEDIDTVNNESYFKTDQNLNNGTEDQESAYSDNTEDDDAVDDVVDDVEFDTEEQLTESEDISDNNLDTEIQKQHSQERQEQTKKQIFIVAKPKSEDNQTDKKDNADPDKIPIYTPIKGKPLYAKSERVLKDIQSDTSAESVYEKKTEEKEFSSKVQDVSHQKLLDNDITKTREQPLEQISFFKPSKKHEVDETLIGKTKVNYNPNEVFFADQRSSKPIKYQSYEDLMLKEKMELFKENISKGKNFSKPHPQPELSLESQLYSLPDNVIPDFAENTASSFGGTYASIEEARQAHKIEKQYKNVLGKLFENKNQNYEIKPKRTKESAQPSQPLNNLTNNLNNNSAYDFSEIKVVPFSKNTASEYYSSDYVYYNKFKLAQNLIFSILMLLTNIGLYFLLNVYFRLNVNIGYYYTGGLVAILFALVASLAYFYKPNRKKKIFFELKKELLNKFYLWLILSASFVLVFYIVDKNLFSSVYNFSKALIAISLSFNILSLPIIAKIMLKLKAFSIKS